MKTGLWKEAFSLNSSFDEFIAARYPVVWIYRPREAVVCFFFNFLLCILFLSVGVQSDMSGVGQAFPISLLVLSFIVAGKWAVKTVWYERGTNVLWHRWHPLETVIVVIGLAIVLLPFRIFALNIGFEKLNEFVLMGVVDLLVLFIMLGILRSIGDKFNSKGPVLFLAVVMIGMICLWLGLSVIVVCLAVSILAAYAGFTYIKCVFLTQRRNNVDSTIVVGGAWIVAFAVMIAVGTTIFFYLLSRDGSQEASQFLLDVRGADVVDTIGKMNVWWPVLWVIVGSVIFDCVAVVLSFFNILPRVESK